MIKSFKDRQAQAIFEGRHPGKNFPANLIRLARRKLIMLAEARALKDLRSPPGNHLEALKGNRVGQHSIRINDQWRLCFIWSGSDAENVEITDYH
ncbi:MAG: type II toxin-antitoxin system RelE/ParE family toxin [Hyphomicrobiaceae bacterium]|nr:MAG: type II toxin-antitoxin system RelE/ParE family toxin [Hyphomicrobiaceae bacterium]